ncbi:MAG: GNAT family N-acetyltransferase [Parvularculaceae bacterium]|nr:GNAT family N-acetyltransferase [Parvularculaceae bacterium]
MALEPITDSHHQAVLELNNQHAAETSELNLSSLSALLDLSFVALQTGDGTDGFLISIGSDAPYDNPNFAWLRARCAAFVYVDRIVVAQHAQGRGLARSFYEALFVEARAKGFSSVVCEVNVDPPNPGSDAFHERMGFEELGQQRLEDRGKTVRYLQKTLTGDA